MTPIKDRRGRQDKTQERPQEKKRFHKVKEWETDERSVCICGSALTKASTYDLQMRVTSRALQQNNRGRQRRKKKTKNTSSPFSHTRPFCLCWEGTAAMSQPRRHVRERRMEWRAHEHERGEGGDWERIRTWSTQMAGENQQDQDSQGSKRCRVRMEGNVTEGEKWQQWSQLHHWSDSCTHPGLRGQLVIFSQSSRRWQQQLHQCLPARCLFCGLHIRRSLHPSLHESSLSSVLSVLRPVLMLWSHQNHVF